MGPLHHTWDEGTVKKWSERGESALKKVIVPCAGKVMASVFWDARRIIFIDCFQKVKKISGKYYANLL